MSRFQEFFFAVQKTSPRTASISTEQRCIFMPSKSIRMSVECWMLSMQIRVWVRKADQHIMKRSNEIETTFHSVLFNSVDKEESKLSFDDDSFTFRFFFLCLIQFFHSIWMAIIIEANSKKLLSSFSSSSSSFLSFIASWIYFRTYNVACVLSNISDVRTRLNIFHRQLRSMNAELRVRFSFIFHSFVSFDMRSDGYR